MSVKKPYPTCWMCYCGIRYVLFLLQLIWPRRFYLTGDMTNFCSFIHLFNLWPFSELFFTDVQLFNQFKYIACNIFSCMIFIISYKLLIITGISNNKRNKLTIYAILCRNVTIFYWQKLVSLFQVHEQLKTFQSKTFQLPVYRW